MLKKAERIVTFVKGKEEIPFSTVMDKATYIQDRCKDFIVKPDSELGIFNACYSSISNLLSYGDEHRKLTKYSLGQLCAKLGVPVRYLENCIATQHFQLADSNINTWLSHYQKNLMLRTFEPDNKASVIRGVLSDRYSRFDAPQIIETLQSVFDEQQYRICGYMCNTERLHIRIIQRMKMKDVLDGEDLYAGVLVDSSDVGRSVLSVRFFIFRQVCTNGMVVSTVNGTLFKRKHMWTPSNLEESLTVALSNIPDLIDYVSRQIKKSASYNPFENRDEDFIANFFKEKANLSDKGVEKVTSLMKNKYGSSLWGAVNSLTEAAQSFTLERRLELEAIAGDMLALVA